jgi:hypothetical protein
MHESGRHLRLYSSGGNSFNAEYADEKLAEDIPAFNVLTRSGGIVRHNWGDEMGESANPGPGPTWRVRPCQYGAFST